MSGSHSLQPPISSVTFGPQRADAGGPTQHTVTVTSSCYSLLFALFVLGEQQLAAVTANNMGLSFITDWQPVVVCSAQFWSADAERETPSEEAEKTHDLISRLKLL